MRTLPYVIISAIIAGAAVYQTDFHIRLFLSAAGFVLAFLCGGILAMEMRIKELKDGKP